MNFYEWWTKNDFNRHTCEAMETAFNAGMEEARKQILYQCSRYKKAASIAILIEKDLRKLK